MNVRLGVLSVQICHCLQQHKCKGNDLLLTACSACYDATTGGKKKGKKNTPVQADANEHLLSDAIISLNHKLRI